MPETAAEWEAEIRAVNERLAAARLAWHAAQIREAGLAVDQVVEVRRRGLTGWEPARIVGFISPQDPGSAIAGEEKPLRYDQWRVANPQPYRYVPRPRNRRRG